MPTGEKCAELFVFNPATAGMDPSSVMEVCVIGDFNFWGREGADLTPYRLEKDGAGRWSAVLEVPFPEGFYRYLINRETYYPEPGHLFYRHSDTPEWARKTVWYQIMTDRFFRSAKAPDFPHRLDWTAAPDHFNSFGGDIAGIQEKLPYLEKLAGTLKGKTLYLNPLHKSSASNHKYWPEDYESIDPQFGTEEDLRNLIEAVHSKDGKIVLDMVFNHTGLNHPAFRNILKSGAKSAYINWYRGLPDLKEDKLELPLLELTDAGEPANITIENNPAADDYDPGRESFISVWNGKYLLPIVEPWKFTSASVKEIIKGQPHYKLALLGCEPNYKGWLGYFEIPELNTASPELKAHLFSAAAKWLKMGVDGFRLDVPDFLNDAHRFWADFRQAMRRSAVSCGRNPDDIYILGEVWSGNALAQSFLHADANGVPARFDAIMNYGVREAILNFYSGEILRKSTDVPASSGSTTPGELDRALHSGLGYVSWGTDLAQYNCTGSHDTRRLATILPDTAALKAVYSMVFTLPGAPAFLYGDELAAEGGADPDCRRTMNWELASAPSADPKVSDVFNHLQGLIRLRDERPCLTSAPFSTVCTDDVARIYAYSRFNSADDCAVTVAARSVPADRVHLDLSDTPMSAVAAWKDALTGKEFPSAGGLVEIPAETFAASLAAILIPA